MPLTALDPNTALIVIDLQKGLVKNVFPRLGETGSTQEIISLLERRSSAL
jgi:nicotinamidase-related amidase